MRREVIHTGGRGDLPEDVVHALTGESPTGELLPLCVSPRRAVPAPRRMVSQLAKAREEWGATQQAIEETREALEAHQNKVPKDRKGVAAWSQKRGELQAALESYTTIAAAQERDLDAAARELSKVLQAAAVEEFHKAKKGMEKAEVESQKLKAQARAVRTQASLACMASAS